MSTTTPSATHGSAVITLPWDTEILITRVFDAPADLVFKAGPPEQGNPLCAS